MKRLHDLRERRAALRREIALVRQSSGTAIRDIRNEAGAAVLGLSIARLFGRKTLLRSVLGVAAGMAAARVFRSAPRSSTRP